MLAARGRQGLEAGIATRAAVPRRKADQDKVSSEAP